MAKRGRPQSDGYQPAWMLRRDTAVVCAYSEARNRGEKHEAAVGEAVEDIRKQYPAMPISETAVKRALAKFQPRDGETAFIVTKPEPNTTRTLPDGRIVKVLYATFLGPRPNHSRANAARWRD
jgi:hypothetical protein